jgi:hypothetical protein
MGITKKQALSRDFRAWRKILLAAKVHNGRCCLRIREQEQEKEEDEEEEEEELDDGDEKVGSLKASQYILSVLQ